MVENYLVNYEVNAKESVTYRSSYTVYIYELDGRGLYLVKEPYISPALAAAVAEASLRSRHGLLPLP